ncbi:MAG: hypothetical protein IH905_12630 [Proteobacteria bacterium]|nr:hypothetical protein [Pseudomonadota bacterium]
MHAFFMWREERQKARSRSPPSLAQRAFGAVVMGKSGTNLESVVSIFIGEVQTSAGGEYLVGKVRC